MIRITKEPIDLQSIVQAVITPASGGINVFVGTTRNHARGRDVDLLEYEAYEPMALRMMQRIVEDARGRWPLHAVAVVHRLGRVEVGEVSVAIAVSSAHRNEAFEACRFLIDELKRVVPIWKREYFSDGSVEWSQQTHEQVLSSKT
jgi:molybdopterin synthase catalytic subunit